MKSLNLNPLHPRRRRAGVSRPTSVLVAMVLTLAAGTCLAARPMNNTSLRAVRMPALSTQSLSTQQGGQTGRTGSSAQSLASAAQSETAAAAAALATPPPLPPNIAVTITNDLMRRFEENPQRLSPNASTPPPAFQLPPATHFEHQGNYGTAQVNLSRQAVDNAQSQAVGNGVLIHTDTQINSIVIKHAQDVSHRELGNIGVHGLNVKGSIRISPQSP